MPVSLSAAKGAQTTRSTDADTYIWATISLIVPILTADGERTRWHCAEDKEIALCPLNFHFPLVRVKSELRSQTTKS